MNLDIKLLIVNIGHLLSIFLILALAVLVYVRGRKTSAAVPFLFLSLVLSVHEAAYLLGINIENPAYSASAFYFTVVYIFIPCLSLHWIYAVLEIVNRKKIVLSAFYILATVVASFYIVFPYSYVGPSLQKLYYTNYFNPGPYFFLSLIFFAGTALFGIFVLAKHYAKVPVTQKKRLKYFLVAIIFAYTVGSTQFFLGFDILIDPFWSMFIGLYSVPLAYAILRYDLMEISLVAKRAFVYALLVGVVSGLIILVNSVNNRIIDEVPGFPGWFIPIVSGLVFILVASAVWRQIRSVDLLKYEFITVVTHKFRTPLTSIRWAAENLNRAVTAEEKGRDLALISEASLRLEELTDRLVGLTDTNVKGKYNYEKTDLHELAVTLLAYYVAKSSEKHITIVDTIATDVTAVVDRERIKFVFQIILDNAVTYTPPGGKIIVRLERNKENVLFTVKDSGIGFTKEERPYLFNKFFRTEDAKRLDTEGMGLGMYLAKEIIEIHGGTITATSEGRNMGALFVASVPLERATR